MNKSKNSKKIAFLYFDNAHVVYHSISLAIALSTRTSHKVYLLCDERSKETIKEILYDYPRHKCKIKELKPSLIIQYLLIKKRKYIFRSICKHNQKLLLSFDIFIGADFKAVWLRSLNKNFYQKKFIKTVHGAGDRAYGFSKKFKQFDFILLAGKKQENRLLQSGYIAKGHYAVIGYLKFDLCKSFQKKLFNNDKPIVLYNPHFDRELSSYFAWGEQIIKFFTMNTDYNLIFAPHINLLERQKKIKFSLKKYEHFSNIIINARRKSCIDMTYTKAADIYLGDVSSQVYEFLLDPKPCIFLNPYKIKWHGLSDYLCWELGDVVDDFLDLKQTLKDVLKNHHKYKLKQKQFVEQAFATSENDATTKGLEALEHYLETIST